jgi:dodecin
MSVAKNIEITSSSSTGFDDAIRSGIARAAKTINNIRSGWVKEQKVEIEAGNVTEYRVTMIVTFVLSDEED